MHNSLQQRSKSGSLIKALALGVCLLTLTACASTPKESNDVRLEKGLSRIELESSHRVPGLFKVSWFGKLIRLQDQNNNTVFSVYSDLKNPEPVKRLDIKPGAYKALIQCQTHTPFKGIGRTALASIDVLLQADKALKLGCESYEKTEKQRSESKPQNNEELLVRVKVISKQDANVY